MLTRKDFIKGAGLAGLAFVLGGGCVMLGTVKDGIEYDWFFKYYTEDYSPLGNVNKINIFR